VKWTAYCITCQQDLVSPLFGNNIHRDPEMVENLARKHKNEDISCQVLIGIYIQRNVPLPQILYFRKGDSKHGRS